MRSYSSSSLELLLAGRVAGPRTRFVAIVPGALGPLFDPNTLGMETRPLEIAKELIRVYITFFVESILSLCTARYSIRVVGFSGHRL